MPWFSDPPEKGKEFHTAFVPFSPSSLRVSRISVNTPQLSRKQFPFSASKLTSTAPDYNHAEESSPEPSWWLWSPTSTAPRHPKRERQGVPQWGAGGDQRGMALRGRHGTHLFLGTRSRCLAAFRSPLSRTCAALPATPAPAPGHREAPQPQPEPQPEPQPPAPTPARQGTGPAAAAPKPHAARYGSEAGPRAGTCSRLRSSNSSSCCPRSQARPQQHQASASHGHSSIPREPCGWEGRHRR